MLVKITNRRSRWSLELRGHADANASFYTRSGVLLLRSSVAGAGSTANTQGPTKIEGTGARILSIERAAGLHGPERADLHWSGHQSPAAAGFRPAGNQDETPRFHAPHPASDSFRGHDGLPAEQFFPKRRGRRHRRVLRRVRRQESDGGRRALCWSLRRRERLRVRTFEGKGRRWLGTCPFGQRPSRTAPWQPGTCADDFFYRRDSPRRRGLEQK